MVKHKNLTMIESIKRIKFSNILVSLFISAMTFCGYAQPTTGNITTDFTNPNASSKTFSHTQDIGSNGLLVVITHQINSSANATGVKYNDVPLTREVAWTVASWRHQVWYLLNPDEGDHDIVVTYGGSIGAAQPCIALSFTDATGIGATGINTSGGYNRARSVNLTVAADSKILGFGLSTAGAITLFRLPNPTDLAMVWNQSTVGGKGIFGAVSTAFSADSYLTTARDANGNVYPMAIEIQADVIVPIKLTKFTSTVTENNFIRLDWQTASEFNNNYFTIERSNNIENWEEVTRIQGAGNSNSLRDYITIDERPYFGTSYYRLKQTDINGEFEYSTILSTYITQNQLLENFIFPNPTKGFITIQHITGEIRDNLRIYNSIGEDVTLNTSIDYQSEVKAIIDMTELNMGIYFLKINNNISRVILE